MARVAVFGADGMLGSALVRVMVAHGHVVTPLDRSQHDLAVAAWSHLPVDGQDWVMNAAGVTKGRSVPTTELWRVNADFPHALAAACARVGARLIHFSTDCVFDGTGAPHDEAAEPTASDAYGRSKARGEPPSALTLRTSIIGPERRRFANLLCWCLRAGEVEGYLDHRWNGVTTTALADAVARILGQELFVAGVRHVHAEDTDKHALLTMIRAAFGHPCPVRAVVTRSSRDMRLCTRHPDFLAALALPPLARQVAMLPSFATTLGAWRTT